MKVERKGGRKEGLKKEKERKKVERESLRKRKWVQAGKVSFFPGPECHWNISTCPYNGFRAQG